MAALDAIAAEHQDRPRITGRSVNLTLAGCETSRAWVEVLTVPV